MKKNKSMRIASVLLVVAILTTSILSGTFAKYITGGTGADSARVAKFGVVIAVNGNLYGEAYGAVGATPSNTIIARGTTGQGTGTVQVDAAGTNVVAPGTKSNKGLGFGVTGTPEVDVQVDTEIEVENIFLTAGTYAVMVPNTTVTAENYVAGTYYTFASNTYTKELANSTYSDTADYFVATDVATVAADYYPVVYTLTGADAASSFTTGDTTADSLAAIADQLAVAFDSTATADTSAAPVTTYATSAIYKANTDLASLNAAASTISWEWAFSVNDGADTILGDLAAGVNVMKSDDSGATYAAPTNDEDYNLDTALSMEISVTQID